MILQALYDLARREGLMEDPDYEPKPVAWIVKVGPGGKFLGIKGTHYTPPAEGKRKPRPMAKKFRVPREPGPARTSGDRAYFLCDTAMYVFGVDVEGKFKGAKANKPAARAALFRERVRECVHATGDEGVGAVSAFLDAVADGSTTADLASACAPDGPASNDLFAFVYAPDVDLLVTDREKPREYWRASRRKALGESAGSIRCLVSGDVCEPSESFPSVKKLPGGTTSGAFLVAFNAPAFESYGWDANANAPISPPAAEACAEALRRLGDPAFPHPSKEGITLPRRNVKLSADTLVCYWTAREDKADASDWFGGLLEADPEQVGEAYRSVWTGRPPVVDDPTAFYALTISAAQARIAVRDWFESTVAEVLRNLALHFGDLDIDRRPMKAREHPPSFPLPLLLEALADPAKDRKEGVPRPLLRDFLRAALSGGPYPFAALQRAVLRYRAEVGRESDEQDGWKTRNWNDARAALIKAALNRKRRLRPRDARFEEVKRDMDPTNASEGYALGRLMAVLERIQQEALKDVNASVVDRYFSGASASPKSVFVRLLKNARHHVRKAEENDQRAGFVGMLDRIVDELADRFDPKRNGFPSFLDQEQQGLFVLGYHQMRRWLWMNKEERSRWESEHANAPRPYLWSAGK